MKNNLCHNNLCHIMKFAFTFFVDQTSATLQRPFGDPSACQRYFSFPLKYPSFELRVFSLKHLASHGKQRKALSPTFTKCLSPASPKPMVMSWLHHFEFDKIVFYDEVTLHRAYFLVFLCTFHH